MRLQSARAGSTQTQDDHHQTSEGEVEGGGCEQKSYHLHSVCNTALTATMDTLSQFTSSMDALCTTS